MTSVVIPDSVTVIGESAFAFCKGLKGVTIPSGVNEISYRTFSDCTNLVDVIIPEGVTEIGQCAFATCISLKQLNLPNSINHIGPFAFFNCFELVDINIPRNLKNVDRSAFDDCTNLSENVKKLLDDRFNYYENNDVDDDEDFDDGYEYDFDNTDDEDFYNWYDSDKRDEDWFDFMDELRPLIESEYDVESIEDETSVRGMSGMLFITVILKNGDEYQVSFDWEKHQRMLFFDGAEYTAQECFKKIKEGIDSGSALW